mgnify:CR=1 FL=1
MILFKSILNEKTASLLLYGEISDEGGDGKIASRDIVNELMYMDGSYENLNIRINSHLVAMSIPVLLFSTPSDSVGATSLST